MRPSSLQKFFKEVNKTVSCFFVFFFFKILEKQAENNKAECSLRHQAKMPNTNVSY